jgi:hypothetical protein
LRAGKLRRTAPGCRPSSSTIGQPVLPAAPGTGTGAASAADEKLEVARVRRAVLLRGYRARRRLHCAQVRRGRQPARDRPAAHGRGEDNVWVLANLKETQLEKVQVGQPVEIKIDALPHHKFPGRVDSIQPGTGSNLALLPPDNATGDFIKIVQRVSVKLLFDADAIRDFRNKIVPGLSTQPSIDVTGRNALRPGPTPLDRTRGKAPLHMTKL